MSGKVALVTGGGQRLGKAIALGLARLGADVAVHFHGSIAGAAIAIWALFYAITHGTPPTIDIQPPHQ